MRSPIPALAAVLVAAALALTGCSMSIPVESPTAESGQGQEVAEESGTALDAAPATGETITGDGYSYTVPEGWGVPSQSIPGFAPDTLAADLTDTDGFADNVNVLKSPAGIVSPELVETAGVDELESAGATTVTVNDRVTVAGSESAHLSAGLANDGTQYSVEQYYISSDEVTYVVTFSFSPTVAPADRVAIAESVLVTWAWS